MNPANYSFCVFAQGLLAYPTHMRNGLKHELVRKDEGRAITAGGVNIKQHLIFCKMREGVDEQADRNYCFEGYLVIEELNPHSFIHAPSFPN